MADEKPVFGLSLPAQALRQLGGRWDGPPQDLREALARLRLHAERQAGAAVPGPDVWVVPADRLAGLYLMGYGLAMPVPVADAHLIGVRVEAPATEADGLDAIARLAGNRPRPRVAAVGHPSWVAVARFYWPEYHPLPEPEDRPMTGLALITHERMRQERDEGFAAEHDDEHARGELWRAAACYVLGTDPAYPPQPGMVPITWPWSPGWWKPSDDRVRNLVKAGALLAAEIDRLLRARDRSADRSVAVDAPPAAGV